MAHWVVSRQAAAAAIIGVIVTGCSKQPTEEDIQRALAYYFEHNAWGHMYGGHGCDDFCPTKWAYCAKAKFESVDQVLEVGSHVKYRGVPVTVKMHFSCWDRDGSRFYGRKYPTDNFYLGNFKDLWCVEDTLCAR